MTNQPRVLITGAAGFLGSHLCERFVADGFQVVGLDNLLTGRMENLKHIQGRPDFTFINADVTSPLSIDGLVDVVLHFACPASPVDYLKHPIHTMKVDSLGTLYTLGLAKSKQARYILASSSEVYGDPEMHPQREDYWGNVNPVGPRSVYDEAKRFSEALTMAYHREHGLDVRILRMFNTYGPRMRLNDGRVIPSFLSQGLKGKPLTIYGNGSQTRSFCYIDDLVEGILRAATFDGLAGEVMNLGNSQEFTILELAKLVLEVTSSASALVYDSLPIDDPVRRQPDISKVNRLLDWEPKTHLQEGLRLSLPYFQAQIDSSHSLAGRQ